MWGLLEHRIRSLPHVVSCSIAPQGLTVLADMGGDAASVRSAVEQVALAAGFTGPIRVIGGSDTTIRPFITSRRVLAASGFAAGIAGAATVLTSVFGTSVGVDPRDQAHTPVARGPIASAPLAPADRTVDTPRSQEANLSEAGSRPVQTRLRTAGDPVTPVREPLHRTVLDPADTDRDVTRPPTRVAEDDEPRAGRPGKADACHAPPDRGAPRARKGRHNGNGPRPWSRSVLVEPGECDRR